MRIRITLRNKAFMFFSLFMPLTIFFLYGSIFAKGDPVRFAILLGPVLSFTIMGTFWGLGLQLVTWRERGILRRFRLAPMSSSSMLAASILANYLLILPTVLLELILARLLYHVQHFGNLTTLFVLVILGITSFGSLGLIVASVTNTMQETQVINQLLWFAMIFLTGATVPLTLLPSFAQRAGLFLPPTYLIFGLQAAILRNAPWYTLGVVVFSLVAWAALAFTVSALLFRWEPEAKLPKNAKLWAVATVIPFVLLGFWENHNGNLLAGANSMFQERLSDQPAPRSEKPAFPAAPNP
jgi:ABC-2 type transport system permease protein